MNLLSLNDDCLRLIIGLLHFDDQTSVFNVCPRLKELVVDVWKRVEVNLMIYECGYFNDHKADFLAYMRSVSDHVQKIDLSDILFTHFLELKSTKFPKVHTLRLHKAFTETDTNEPIKVIAKIFPNVKTLKLCGFHITGEYFWDFKQVEDLELDFHDEFHEKHLKKILSKLNLKRLSIVYGGRDISPINCFKYMKACKTLEALWIDDYQFIKSHKELSKVKTLRSISCHMRYRIKAVMQTIIETYGNVLDKFVFCTYFWSEYTNCEWVQKMVALRQLIFFNDFVNNAQLSAIAAALSETLEEFYYLKGSTTNCDNSVGLLDIVRLCKKLKIFDISGTPVDVSFVERIIEMLPIVNEQRKEPLLLRCHNTKITEEQLKNLNVPGDLQISFKRNEFQFKERMAIEFEWRIPAKIK